MVSSDKEFGRVVGGKSARACDNCVRKRARWYCAADDAFLCQCCDSSVHSANPLSRRHERVRLKSSSPIKSFNDRSRSRLRISVPSWHKGFARKARTPRKNKRTKLSAADVSIGPTNRLVPEILENSQEDNEEQLLYRVPVFDPCVAELCISVSSNEGVNDVRNDGEVTPGFGRGSKPEYNEMGHVEGFLPSEMDLAQFAADVESLLGKGLEDHAFDIEGLGILDGERECCMGSERVKVEDEESGEVVNHQIDGDQFIGFGRETFELNFDYDSPNNYEEDHTVDPIMVTHYEDSNQVYESKKIFLRLDYEGVISSWDENKSPWTNGERPELNPNDCWLDCTGTCGVIHVYGDVGMTAAGDGGREARVSRYREKRRTRLFSKKIRYEVRKLNAEKRPRMKGRFVKRANLVAPAALSLLNK